MLVLASFAVRRLTLVCVCACSCVCVSISYVESLKFEGGAMVDMVPRHYFHLRSVRVFCRFSQYSSHVNRICHIFAVYEAL